MADIGTLDEAIALLSPEGSEDKMKVDLVVHKMMVEMVAKAVERKISAQRAYMNARYNVGKTSSSAKNRAPAQGTGNVLTIVGMSKKSAKLGV